MFPEASLRCHSKINTYFLLLYSYFPGFPDAFSIKIFNFPVTKSWFKSSIIKIQNPTERGGEALGYDIGDLYKSYYKILYNYVYVMTLNRHDSEDIVQNTFLKAMNGIAGFRGSSSIKTWLLKIAHNECVNYFRKNTDAPVPDNLTIVREDTLSNQLCIKEDVRKILLFIQAQEEPVRSLMILRLIRENSFAEIGEILNQTEVWCRVTFFRTKKRLLDELKDQFN